MAAEYTEPPVGAYVGVTTILNVPRKPGLEKWKIEQAVMTAVNSEEIAAGMEASEVLSIVNRKMWEGDTTSSREGVTVHDAIDVYFEDGTIHPDHAETIRALSELIKQHCGDQKWKTKQRFSHPLGYVGVADLLSDEWILDFKTKDGDATKHRVYADQIRQLVAYDMGFSENTELYIPTRKKANILISRDIPGSVAWRGWDGVDEQREWRQFKRLLEYWQEENRCLPNLEQAA